MRAVVWHADCEYLYFISRQQGATIMSRFERILFPIDFSERSRAAAPFVLSMAQRYHAKVVALHVLQPPPPLYAGMNTVYPEVYDFEGLTADLRQEVQKFTDAELPKVDVTCVVET